MHSHLYSDDLDSITNNLRDSAKGSFVTYDDTFPLTYFEPELTLTQLRGRLHLIHPHWPSYPSGVDIIFGDFNICDPEEGRFHV